MSGQLIGALILWLILGVAVVAVAVWLLGWLYHRSTKEVSFVRTGFGGEKVVINGGALVLPILHEVTPVNMNVTRLPVSRARETAVSTRDRMRVDIEADFFIRVLPTREGVSAAAATLGRRTLEPERLTELLEGKFVGALRSVAAEMSLDEMHEKRSDFVAQVAARAGDVLTRNGLELESVSITDLDQTDLEFFNPANRFDAEGLTQLIDTIEGRRKLRNDIEQSSLVLIRARNLAAEKETLQIERDSMSARLDQEREIEAMRAAQRAEVARTQSSREAEAAAARIDAEQDTTAREIARRRAVEEAEIAAREEIEARRIAHERALEIARIGRVRDVRAEEIAERAASEEAEIRAEQELRGARIAAEEASAAREIERERALESARIGSRKEIDAARIAQELAIEKVRIEREKVVRSLQIGERQATAEAEITSREEIERARIASDRSLEEARILFERDTRRLEVERAQVVELAEIERQIAVLSKQAEESQARAATEVARGKAVLAEEGVATSRETEVARRIAAIDRLMAEKDADTARIAVEVEKVRAAVTAEARRLANEAENLLSDDARAGRIREKMLDRLEGIVRESVKPMEKIEGIKIVQMDGFGGGGASQHRSPTDEVIDSALRFRAQAPLIDEMMKEIGVENAGVAKMGDIFRSAKDAKSLSRTTRDKDDD